MTGFSLNMWYRLTLTVDDVNSFKAEIRQRDTGSGYASAVLPMATGRSWYFNHYMVGTTAWLDNYSENKVGPQTTLYIGKHWERNMTTGIMTQYYYHGGQRVAMRVGSTTTSTVTYLHGDHLGSASLETNDTTGGRVAELRYTPFGETYYQSAALSTDKRFTGQREEIGSGLYDYGARFYSPLFGHFISADTVVPGVGNPQAWNRYSYTLGRPLIMTDPTGHWIDRPGERQDPLPNDGRHMRTGQAGIIDREHAISSIATAYDVLKQVNNMVGRGGTFSVQGNLAGSSLLLEVVYEVASGITKSQADGIALAIYQDYQSRFEQSQGDHGIFWSTFSFEDLPSDLVAFSMAKTGYNLGTTMQDLEGYKGAEFGGTPGDMYGDMIYPTNHEFKPIYTDGPNEGKNYDWPDRFTNALNVQPISTGWSAISQSTPLSQLKDSISFP